MACEDGVTSPELPSGLGGIMSEVRLLTFMTKIFQRIKLPPNMSFK